MEEGVGFEPAEPLGSLVFKTRAIAHSANLPLWWEYQDSNLSRQSQRVYSPSPLTTRAYSHGAGLFYLTNNQGVT